MDFKRSDYRLIWHLRRLLGLPERQKDLREDDEFCHREIRGAGFVREQIEGDKKYRTMDRETRLHIMMEAYVLNRHTLEYMKRVRYHLDSCETCRTGLADMQANLPRIRAVRERLDSLRARLQESAP